MEESFVTEPSREDSFTEGSSTEDSAMEESSIEVSLYSVRFSPRLSVEALSVSGEIPTDEPTDPTNI